ncbi:MAG: replication-associated recombination protein A, partial [Geminicoccaceae bacterium]
YKAATASAAEHGSLLPPAHILNAPTALMKKLGYGKDYAYDHDAPDRFSGQTYFPDGMPRETYYRPTDEGIEARIKARLDRLAELRRERGGE